MARVRAQNVSLMGFADMNFVQMGFCSNGISLKRPRVHKMCMHSPSQISPFPTLNKLYNLIPYILLTGHGIRINA